MEKNIKMNFNKQLEIINYKDFKDKTISIIGCGSIGSVLAEALSKIGFGQSGYGTIKLFDYDEIEAGNLANQFYFPKQINMKKVDALKDNLSLFNCNSVKTYDMKVSSEDMEIFNHINADIVVLAVDDNDSRRDIMEEIIPFLRSCEAVIETGMNLTGTKVSYFMKNNWDTILGNWIKSWVPSSEQKVSACGITETAYPTVMNACVTAMGFIINHYRSYWKPTKDGEKRTNTKVTSIDYDTLTFRGTKTKNGIVTVM